MVSVHLSLKQERIIWMWKLNSESDKWNRYDDVENCMIESAYQEKKNQMELDNSWINFESQTQINKEDPNEQMPIKRVMNPTDDYIRQERFIVQEPKLREKSFTTGLQDSCVKAIKDSNMKYTNSFSKSKFPELSSFDCFLEQVACGIAEQGAKLGEKKRAEWIANEFRKLQGRGHSEVGTFCIKLYTMESFLYKQINKFMREADIERLDSGNSDFSLEVDKEYARTLGTYCSLLDNCIIHPMYHRHTSNYICTSRMSNIVVYRSANLSDEMIEDYKKHVGKIVYWEAFTSTTKNKHVAMHYDGNTLFEIYITKNSYGFDISLLSQYPEEEEVLLETRTAIKINKVEYDLTIRKHVIHLKTTTSGNDGEDIAVDDDSLSFSCLDKKVD